ncbi:MAG: hypothetical protein ACI9CE_002228 [Flavobacterium sp.]|jgi:hypothetical protein
MEKCSDDITVKLTETADLGKLIWRYRIYDCSAGTVYNLFNLGRHLVSAETYLCFRLRSFASWKNAAGV